MADPARYDVFAVLRIRKTQNNGEYPVAELEHERHESGDWIKWADFVDYKAARRRNSTEDAVTRLGVEVAQLRAENERLKEAWVDKKMQEDRDVLRAENERLSASVRHYVEQDALRKAGEAIHQQRIESGSYNREKNETIKRLAAENERLRKAGDDLESDLFLRMNLNAPLPSSIAEWHAAKEGRDAK